MRILCLSLSSFDKVGGIQTFNNFFYKALNQNKLNYKVISLHDKFSPDKHVHVCHSSYIKFFYLLCKYSNHNTVNVWQHISLTFFLPIIKIFIKPKRNILTLYGTEVWGKKLSFIKKIGLTKIDQYWCISNYTANQILKKYNIEKQKIKIFPCCIDIPKKLVKQKNPYKTKAFNILSILRLDKSGKLNAIFEILKAMSYIKKSKIDIHFTILGDGNYKKKIIQIINENNLRDKVSLLGYVEDTRPYIEHCDLFTLTSPLEGFGIVYLEAMLYKKACISSKNCGSEDVVLHKRTGYSIESNDIKELSHIIKKMNSEKKYKNKLGVNGYNHLIKNFTFTKFKENQLKLLSL